MRISYLHVEQPLFTLGFDALLRRGAGALGASLTTTCMATVSKTTGICIWTSKVCFSVEVVEGHLYLPKARKSLVAESKLLAPNPLGDQQGVSSNMALNEVLLMTYSC